MEGSPLVKTDPKGLESFIGFSTSGGYNGIPTAALMQGYPQYPDPHEANDIAMIWLGVVTAPVSVIDDLLGLGVASSAKICLGHYPEYLNLAQKGGFDVFKIPANVWNNMSDADRWAANQQFLDQAIANQSQIIFATPPSEARSGSYFEKEIQYLQSKGYLP